MNTFAPLPTEEEKYLRGLHDQTVHPHTYHSPVYGTGIQLEETRPLSPEEWQRVQALIATHSLVVWLDDYGQSQFSLSVYKHPEHSGEKLELLLFVPMKNLPDYQSWEKAAEGRGYDSMMDVAIEAIKPLVWNEQNLSLLAHYKMTLRNPDQYRY